MQESTKEIQGPEQSSSNKKSKFWWRFLQLTGAYLVSTWTILQFMEWIFERNQISPYWVDFFLWIFIGLLPSFMFYLFNKARIDQWRLKWKDSLILFGNVLLLIISLFIGFRTKDLGATNPKTFSTLMPMDKLFVKPSLNRNSGKGSPYLTFEGKQMDSSLKWLETGIRSLLSRDIRQDKAIFIADFPGNIPMATKVSATDGADYFVDGQYNYSENQYTITPSIYVAGNGKLKAQRSFSGNNLLELIDSISVYIRQQADISESLMEASTDLPIQTYTSNSLKAIQYYCEGTYASLERALELDSTFALASLSLGRRLFYADISELDTKFYLDLAFRHRRKLPFDIQYSVLSYRHIIYNDLKAAEETLQLQLEIDPESDVLNNNLVLVYELGRQYEKLLSFAETWSNRDIFAAADAYASALHLNLEAQRLLTRAKPFLNLYPKNEFILFNVFKAHLINEDWEEARVVLKKMKLTRPELEAQLQLLEKCVNYLSDHGFQSTPYKSFLGEFRRFTTERTIHNFIHPKKDDLLVGQVPNGTCLFFPFTKNQLLEINDWGAVSIHEVSRDSTDVAYGLVVTTFTGNHAKGQSFFFWKIDPLVQRAESLLLSREFDQAEKAYLEAIAANPNHYFLKNGLAHIRYIKGRSDDQLNDQFQSAMGSYGDRNFWLDQNRLFYKRAPIDDYYFPQMELLPIAEDRYINFTRQYTQYGFDYEGHQAKASYTYIYNRDSVQWQINDLAEDYKLRLKN